MAANSNNNQAPAEIKKPFIKNNTLMGLIIAIGVIAAIAILVLGFLNSREEKSSENPAKTELAKISDYITDMVASGDLYVTYIYSNQRKVLKIVGSNGYYTVQHSGKNLFFGQGTYTAAATTDELKISEAKADASVKTFSENVTDFSVENYNNGNDTFGEGVIKLRLRVEKDGSSDYLNFDIPLPTASK